MKKDIKFGNLSTVKKLMADNQLYVAPGILKMAAKVSDFVKAKQTGKNKKNAANFKCVREVTIDHLYVKVHFAPKTPVSTKKAVRDMLEKKGLVYQDKSYSWRKTESIKACTKNISIGPWSKNVFVTNSLLSVTHATRVFCGNKF